MNKTLTTLLLLFTTVLSVGFYSNRVLAQSYDSFDQAYTDASSVNESDIDITTNPEFPQAFETITLRSESNSTDLNRYKASWYIGGSLKQSGIGKRNFELTLGDYGTTTTVTYIVELPEKSLSKTLTFSPADASIIWEAVDSYAPLFYKGKKLPAEESLIRINALPNFTTSNGMTTPANNAVYLWKRNKQLIPNSGGYGKKSILIQHNPLRSSELISVHVSDKNNVQSADRELSIPIYDPVIHFYQQPYHQPNLGMALDDGFTMRTDTMNVIAVPYFFSLSDQSWSDTNQTWRLNKDELSITDIENPLLLNISRASETGSNVFSLTMKGITKTLQSASGGFRLDF